MVHGLVATGPNLTTAFTNAVIVEEGAKIAYYVHSILGKTNPIPEAECRLIRQDVVEKYGQKATSK